MTAISSRRPRWVIAGRTLAAGCLGAGLLVASLPLVPAAISAQQGPMLLSVDVPDRPATGARVFSSKRCIRCHSIGTGLNTGGPDLGRVLLESSVFDVAGALWNHSPAMGERMAELGVARPVISPDEMTELLTFLASYRYEMSQMDPRADTQRGRGVFTAKGCASCHEGAEALGRLGPDLQKYRGKASAIYLAQAMWNHASQMNEAMETRRVAWPRLSGREMGDLVAHLRDDAAPTSGDVTFQPGRPTRGKRVFSVKGCDTCHAIGGAGGSVGPDLGSGSADLGSVPDIAAAMWNHSQGMQAEFQRRGTPQVTFSGQEMADLISYLYFVNASNVRGLPARGSNIFSSKCSSCHSIGAGPRVGPDLATVADALDSPIDVISAMWNHGAAMEAALASQNLEWPELEPGETAHLVAFILSNRRAAGQ